MGQLSDRPGGREAGGDWMFVASARLGRALRSFAPRPGRVAQVWGREASCAFGSGWWCMSGWTRTQRAGPRWNLARKVCEHGWCYPSGVSRTWVCPTRRGISPQVSRSEPCLEYGWWHPSGVTRTRDGPTDWEEAEQLSHWSCGVGGTRRGGNA